MLAACGMQESADLFAHLPKDAVRNRPWNLPPGSAKVEIVYYCCVFSSGRRHTRCLSDWSSDVCSSDLMATAKMVQGVIHGVDRPALAGIFPTLIGKPVVVIDVGANVDCSPRMLAQFAVMGEVYSRVVLHQPRPKVGLLSIGEEEHKGNDTTRGATPLLKSLPIDFVGN